MPSKEPQSFNLDVQPIAAARTLAAGSGAAGPFLTSVPIDALQIGDYLRIIQRHWRGITGAVLLGSLAGVLLTSLQTPQFRARTSIEIQNINSDFLHTKEVRPVSDEPQGTDAVVDLQTQIEILQSEMLARNTKLAMKQIGLKRIRLARPAAARLLFRGGEAAPPHTDAVLNSIVDSLKVKQVGQTRMIQIQVDAPNPHLAADFANTLVAEYKDQTIRARWQMTEAAEDWTRTQLADMRQKLKASEEGLQRYASDHQLVFTSERQNISDDRLRQVQTDLLHARADLAEKEARRQSASSSIADSLPDVVRDTDLRELRTKLIDLRRQEAELLTVFKPDYSDVRKVRAQIDELDSAITRERDRIVSRIVNEYGESSRREKLLAGAYDEAVRRSAIESQTVVQYDILKRELEANLSAYQEMLGRVKELSLAAAIRTSNVRVIDVAEPPDNSNSPKMPLNIAYGLLSGLTLGIGFVVLQERSNQNLRHPGEAALRLGVPELGVIASIGDDLVKTKALRLYKSPAAVEDRLSVFGATEEESQAPTTDDFRTLLTSILFSGDKGRPSKVILITSAVPQDGKTTIAANLAVAFARSGKRVLLVDGDLRSPQIHKLFGVPNVIGLRNLLQSSATVEQAQHVLLNTSIARLSVLTSGSFTEAPADLLFEPHLRLLFAAYRERFDMVIVDSPPMMRMPDARLLGRVADGVVLVARSNRTSRDSILMACHRLTLDRTRVLGVVLNDWKGERSPYPYPS